MESTQEGQKLVKKVNQSIAKEQPPEFPPESVSNQICNSWVLKQSFTVLNKAEFEKVWGRKPRQRDPACCKLSVRTFTGEVEDVWLFRDADAPYRKLEFPCSMGETREQYVMEGKGMYHEEQGMKMHACLTKQRLSGQKQQEILQKGLSIPTLAEHGEKLEGVATKDKVQPGEMESPEFKQPMVPRSSSN